MSKARYCSITKYLEKKHKKLYDLLENDLCLATELRVKRNLSGSTFIIPTSKQVDDLVKKVNNGDYDAPVDVMLCHVLRDYLPTPAAFNAHKDDIPNGHGQKADIVAGNKVTVNGAEIELVKDFQAMSKGPTGKTKLVVYQAKGEMKTSSSAPKATFKNTRIERNADGGKKTKKGGGYRLDGSGDFLLHLRRKVEANYLRSVLSARNEKNQMCNPYMDALASYLSFCEYNPECDYESQVKYCDPGAQGSFYVLFGTKNMPGVAEMAYVSRWNQCGCPKVNQSTSKYLRMVSGAGPKLGDGVYGGGQLMDDAMKATLANAYKLIEKDYSASQGCVLGHDELRAIVQESFYKLENDHFPCKGDVDRVLEDVHSMSANGSFLNPETKYNGILRSGVKDFANSPWHCYLVRRAESMKSPEYVRRAEYAAATYTDKQVSYKWIANFVGLLKKSGDRETLREISEACKALAPVPEAPDVSGGAGKRKKHRKKKGGDGDGDAENFLADNGDGAEDFLAADGDDAGEGFLGTGTSHNNFNNDGLEGENGAIGSVSAADMPDATGGKYEDLDLTSGGFNL